jgi:hypothetical protein
MIQFLKHAGVAGGTYHHLFAAFLGVRAAAGRNNAVGPVSNFETNCFNGAIPPKVAGSKIILSITPGLDPFVGTDLSMRQSNTATALRPEVAAPLEALGRRIKMIERISTRATVRRLLVPMRQSTRNTCFSIILR